MNLWTNVLAKELFDEVLGQLRVILGIFHKPAQGRHLNSFPSFVSFILRTDKETGVFKIFNMRAKCLRFIEAKRFIVARRKDTI